MAQNVVFPLAMMYPNRLLSSHFYDEEQKKSAFLKEIKTRQSYYRTLLRDVIRKTPSNDPKFMQARQTLSAIMHDNKTPNPVAIHSLLPLFDKSR